jgi:hypothetical protein
MITEVIFVWCLFGLGVACLITFASSAYDEFMSRKSSITSVKANSKIVTPSTSVTNGRPGGPQKFMIAGYDSPELFREDLWLRRIDQARKEHVELGAIPPFKARTEVRHDYHRQVCAMLAQHWGTRCDN